MFILKIMLKSSLIFEFFFFFQFCLAKKKEIRSIQKIIRIRETSKNEFILHKNRLKRLDYELCPKECNSQSCATKLILKFKPVQIFKK